MRSSVKTSPIGFRQIFLNLCLHRGQRDSTLDHSMIQTKQKKWSQLSIYPRIEFPSKQIPHSFVSDSLISSSSSIFSLPFEEDGDCFGVMVLCRLLGEEDTSDSIVDWFGRPDEVDNKRLNRRRWTPLLIPTTDPVHVSI